MYIVLQRVQGNNISSLIGWDLDHLFWPANGKGVTYVIYFLIGWDLDHLLWPKNASGDYTCDAFWNSLISGSSILAKQGLSFTEPPNIWWPLHICALDPRLGPISLRLMTSQFKDIISHTQKLKPVKSIFCHVWLQNFVWNFKWHLWNFTFWTHTMQNMHFTRC